MTAAPKMAQTMLLAMGLMTVAFWAYAFAVIFTRARALALTQEPDAAWVAERFGAAGTATRAESDKELQP